MNNLDKQVAEVLWLIEVSDTAFLNGRGFWTGEGWGWDALKAARFPTKECAEKCAREAIDEYLCYLPGHKIEICDHMFGCGISDNEKADHQSLCARAYSILSEHWDDYTEDGYGPSTLLRDLEKSKDGKEVRDISLLNEQLHKALKTSLTENKALREELDNFIGVVQQYINSPESKAARTVVINGLKALNSE